MRFAIRPLRLVLHCGGLRHALKHDRISDAMGSDTGRILRNLRIYANASIAFNQLSKCGQAARMASSPISQAISGP